MKDCPGGKLAFAEQLVQRLERRPCTEPHPSGVHIIHREAVAAYRHACTNYDELLEELSMFCQDCLEQRDTCPCDEEEDIEIGEFAHDLIKSRANRM